MDYINYEVLIYHGEDMERELQEALQEALELEAFMQDACYQWDEESEQAICEMFEAFDGVGEW